MISPASLSYMINGKRPSWKDLYHRYMRVVNVESDCVNTFKETDRNLLSQIGGTDWVRTSDLALMKRPL